MDEILLIRRNNPERTQNIMSKSVVSVIAILAALIAGVYVGKFNSKSIPPWDPEPTPIGETTVDNEIVAQGKLEPYGGVYNVFVPQGQTVTGYKFNDKLDQNAGIETFAEGVYLEKGFELVSFTGQKLLRKQSELAAAKISDADLELEAAVAKAQFNYRVAAMAHEEAKFKLKQVEAEKDQSINEKKLENARKKLERMKLLASDPEMGKLISKQKIEDQQLEFEDAELQLEKAKKQVKQAEEAAKFAVDAAKENMDDAEKALKKSIEARDNPPVSLKAAKDLADANENMGKIKSPISGRVLKIFVKPGESVVSTPLLQMGNVQKMQCIAEVSDRMVGKVKINDRVEIASPAFGDQPIKGTVRKIGKMVGDGSLPMPNPLAMVDKKTVDVVIEIDEGDVAKARDYINLQVTVKIKSGNQTAPAASNE